MKVYEKYISQTGIAYEILSIAINSETKERYIAKETEGKRQFNIYK